MSFNESEKDRICGHLGYPPKSFQETAFQVSVEVEFKIRELVVQIEEAEEEENAAMPNLAIDKIHGKKVRTYDSCVAKGNFLKQKLGGLLGIEPKGLRTVRD